MNKHHLPRNENHGCATQCPTDEKCGVVCGEFKFTAPATVYSFNADDSHPVYQIVDGIEHPVGVFGGKTPFQRKFDICGEYVIRWCVRGNMPDCEVDKPVFYVSDCCQPCHADRRDMTPFTRSWVNEGSNLKLGFPPGTMGEIVSVTEAGTGIVRWAVDGSDPSGGGDGNYYLTRGAHHGFTLKNVDLSKFRIDGSSSKSGFSVAGHIYNQ
jgi:hypothetical protein